MPFADPGYCRRNFKRAAGASLVSLIAFAATFIVPGLLYPDTTVRVDPASFLLGMVLATNISVMYWVTATYRIMVESDHQLRHRAAMLEYYASLPEDQRPHLRSRVVVTFGQGPD